MTLARAAASCYIPLAVLPDPIESPSRFPPEGDDRAPLVYRRARRATIRPIWRALLVALAVLPLHSGWQSEHARVPLAGDGTSWLVKATIDGRACGNLLLDTGASYCVVAPALVRALGLPVTGRFATVETANGPVRAPVVRLPSVVLDGGARVYDVDAIVHDAGPGLDGVLGLNLLNRYRYAVDPQRHLLELD
jgi:clan AA aspartic protease (TIGR02281 family)